jgi:hypothetical protein
MYVLQVAENTLQTGNDSIHHSLEIPRPKVIRVYSNKPKEVMIAISQWSGLESNDTPASGQAC